MSSVDHTTHTKEGVSKSIFSQSLPLSASGFYSNFFVFGFWSIYFTKVMVNCVDYYSDTILPLYDYA